MSQEYQNDEIVGGHGSHGTHRRVSSTDELDWEELSGDSGSYDSDDDDIDDLDEDDEKRLQQLSEKLEELSTSISSLREENADLARLIISAYEESLELGFHEFDAKSCAITRPPTPLDARPRKRARSVTIGETDGSPNISKIE
jgi:hypothetical protein